MIHVWITPHECGPFAALEGVAAGDDPATAKSASATTSTAAERRRTASVRRGTGDPGPSTGAPGEHRLAGVLVVDHQRTPARRRSSASADAQGERPVVPGQRPLAGRSASRSAS